MGLLCISTKCTIQPCMEYCYHVRAGTPSCYFEMLDKLQKWICRTVVPSFATSLGYYFGRCSSELVQLVPLTYFQGRSSCYSDRLHNFSVTIPRCYKDALCQQVVFFNYYLAAPLPTLDHKYLTASPT